MGSINTRWIHNYTRASKIDCFHSTTVRKFHKLILAGWAKRAFIMMVNFIIFFVVHLFLSKCYYYIISLEDSDFYELAATCFCCGCSFPFEDDDANNEPWITHVYLSPKCKFLVLSKGNDFVQQTLKWTFFFPEAKVSVFRPRKCAFKTLLKTITIWTIYI